MPDDLSQYLPTWQEDGRGLGATPPADNPPLAPAYGQPQPDGDGGPIAATMPPPFNPQSSAPDQGGPSTIPDVIIVFNGTAYYCTLEGSVGDAV